MCSFIPGWNVNVSIENILLAHNSKMHYKHQQNGLKSITQFSIWLVLCKLGFCMCGSVRVCVFVCVYVCVLDKDNFWMFKKDFLNI